MCRGAGLDESKRLLAVDSNALHSASGELLFVREGTLLRQSFDVTTLELNGDPTPVAEQVAVGNFRGAFSVSKNGVLGLPQRSGHDRKCAAGLVRSHGKLVETFGPPGPFRGVDVSPDGKRIAVARHDGNGGDIWLLDSGTARDDVAVHVRRLAGQRQSVWSPDGNRIVFGSLRNGKWGVYEKAASGTGAEQLLTESDLPDDADGGPPMGNSSSTGWLIRRRQRPVDISLRGDKKPFRCCRRHSPRVTRKSRQRKVGRIPSNESGRRRSLCPPLSDR